ncbi:MAG: GxxExxY protein [Treponema sp.]|nr:GxxExxY protein [Treponema sp.]
MRWILLIETEENFITEKIIGAAYKVARTLGYVFLEKVYENAMVLELRKIGLMVKNQFPISVFYEGKVIGEYFADLFVESSVIVELKTVSEIAPIHKAQLLNYLRATKIKTGLLINFGASKVEVKRLLNDKS